MNRLEKFREIRRFRRKYISSFFLFFVLLVAGICIVDYSGNYLMQDERRITIASVKNNRTNLEINLLNYKFYLNITYINRDIERIREAINRVIKSR